MFDSVPNDPAYRLQQGARGGVGEAQNTRGPDAQAENHADGQREGEGRRAGDGAEVVLTGASFMYMWTTTRR